MLGLDDEHAVLPQPHERLPPHLERRRPEPRRLLRLRQRQRQTPHRLERHHVMLLPFSWAIRPSVNSASSTGHILLSQIQYLPWHSAAGFSRVIGFSAGSSAPRGAESGDRVHQPGPASSIVATIAAIVAPPRRTLVLTVHPGRPCVKAKMRSGGKATSGRTGSASGCNVRLAVEKGRSRWATNRRGRYPLPAPAANSITGPRTSAQLGRSSRTR